MNLDTLLERYNFLRHIPGLRQMGSVLRGNRYGANPFLEFARPGHFYSPLPDLTVVDRQKARLFNRQIESIPGIEHDVARQRALIDEFVGYYKELPFTSEPCPGLRYYFDNPWFRHADAIVLYSMLRRFRPRRIIEVGSGFSSAVMLDTTDLFPTESTTFTFIEPYPERLLALLRDDDRKRCEIIVKEVQDVPLERFATLQEQDILFIDSSHVAKLGSDVVHLLTYVLPALNKGVIVHFHDIPWPFEYPERWIREGRAWNEAYILKAFLQFNTKFRILFFNSYLATHCREMVGQALPLFLQGAGGGSLWIEKTA